MFSNEQDVRLAVTERLTCSEDLRERDWTTVETFVREQSRALDECFATTISTRRMALANQLPAGADPDVLWQVFAHFGIAFESTTAVNGAVYKLMMKCEQQEGKDVKYDTDADRKFRVFARQIRDEWSLQYELKLKTLHAKEIKQFSVCGIEVRACEANFNLIQADELFSHHWYRRTSPGERMLIHMPWFGKRAYCLDVRPPMGIHPRVKMFMQQSVDFKSRCVSLVANVAKGVACELIGMSTRLKTLSLLRLDHEARVAFHRDRLSAWLNSVAPKRSFMDAGGNWRPNAIFTTVLSSIAEGIVSQCDRMVLISRHPNRDPLLVVALKECAQRIPYNLLLPEDAIFSSEQKAAWQQLEGEIKSADADERTYKIACVAVLAQTAVRDRDSWYKRGVECRDAIPRYPNLFASKMDMRGPFSDNIVRLLTDASDMIRRINEKQSSAFFRSDAFNKRLGINLNSLRGDYLRLLHADFLPRWTASLLQLARDVTTTTSAQIEIRIRATFQTFIDLLDRAGQCTPDGSDPTCAAFAARADMERKWNATLIAGSPSVQNHLADEKAVERIAFAIHVKDLESQFISPSQVLIPSASQLQAYKAFAGVTKQAVAEYSKECEAVAQNMTETLGCMDVKFDARDGAYGSKKDAWLDDSKRRTQQRLLPLRPAPFVRDDPISDEPRKILAWLLRAEYLDTPDRWQTAIDRYSQVPVYILNESHRLNVDDLKWSTSRGEATPSLTALFRMHQCCLNLKHMQQAERAPIGIIQLTAFLRSALLIQLLSS
jgi:hypothetical protein